MKTLLIACLAVASVGMLVPACGAAQSETLATAPAAASQSAQVRLGLLARTTALLGAKVRDRTDSGVGRMEDILVDLSAGQAVAVLFSFGSDNQLLLVPSRTFLNASKSKVLVNADKKTLKGAPGVVRTELSLGLEPDSLSRSFSYFSQELPNATAADPGGLLSAAAIVQKQVLSQSNEPLGQVADIVVDLPVGRVVYLLVQPPGGGEATCVLYAVPPQSARREASGQGLILQTDRAHFLAGPRFQKEFGTELSRPEFAAAVQQHYAVRATATGAAEPTRPQGQARGEATGAGTPGASARSDQEIIQAIMTEIVRSDNSFSMRDLRITTSNGRVTLASRVKNEKQKQLLVAAAARVVGMPNVEIQLETQQRK